MTVLVVENVVNILSQVEFRLYRPFLLKILDGNRLTHFIWRFLTQLAVSLSLFHQNKKPLLPILLDTNIDRLVLRLKERRPRHYFAAQCVPTVTSVNRGRLWVRTLEHLLT